IVKKVKDYNEWLIKQPGYTTNFLNIDDVIAITTKG
ncbi:methyltransferase, partial [Staphylococcus sp. 5313]